MFSLIHLVYNFLIHLGCREGDLIRSASGSECPAATVYSSLVVDEEAEFYVIFNKTIAEYRVNSSNYCLLENVIRRCMSSGIWSGEEPHIQESM